MDATVSMLLSLLIVVAALAAWNFTQIRALTRRLTALEKEHLAMVQQLEERLYQ